MHDDGHLCAAGAVHQNPLSGVDRAKLSPSSAEMKLTASSMAPSRT